MRNILKPLLLAFLAGAALSIAAAATPKTPANWHFGVALSDLADPFAAADAAAGKAKAKLGGVPAKIVVVGAAEPQVTPALLEGVKKHFPGDIIYGCQVSSPLTAEGNFSTAETVDIPVGVAVWALGGDVDVTAESVATDEDDDNPYKETGIRLGELLRPAAEAAKRPGKIILTFGDQYTGANKDFVRGLNEGLDWTYPIIGGAAGNITAKVIIKGEIVTGVNVGILISGEFRVAQALNGGTHSPETAEKTLAYAVSQGQGQTPFFALVFDCRRRRQTLMEKKQLGEELEAIRSQLPGVEFFGFYGPGEVGSEKPGKAAIGAGFTVSAAVFFAE